MRYLALALLLSMPCYSAESNKATGVAVVEIIAPTVFEMPTAQEVTEDILLTIVYTDEGATAQIVF